MERVAFLIEETGERITCLLNPDSVVQRRTAGLRAHGNATGVLTGTGLSDDPLIPTGGGLTEIDLDLLFDVDLAREERNATGQLSQNLTAMETGAQAAAGDTPLLEQRPEMQMDVRDLTRAFWALAENAPGESGFGAPPVVRMIWGRAWNVPGVVTAVAERLERFSSTGVPGRSWMRLRLRRVSETASRPVLPAPATPQFELPVPDLGIEGETGYALALTVAADGFPANRLDQVAAEYYGDPSYWWFIAAVNGVDDPLNLSEGIVLSLPGIPSEGGA